MNIQERYQKFITHVTKHPPRVETELQYESAYQLLVAVILSAQCTDIRVNMTTPAFFKKFPTVQSLAKSTDEEVLPYIKSISYPKNKAKSLVGMAKTLLEKYNGNVPDTIEELQELPGVGRKSANIILGVIYKKPVMPVDTHVFRVSERLGLTENAKNPLITEMQLTANIPEEKLLISHHWLVLHGRYICTAKNPKCRDCGVADFCKNNEK